MEDRVGKSNIHIIKISEEYQINTKEAILEETVVAARREKKTV